MGRADEDDYKWQGNGISRDRSAASPATNKSSLPAMATCRSLRVYVAYTEHRTSAGQPVLKQPTAKHIWDALTVTYGSGGDKLLIYDLHIKAGMVKQGNQSLEEVWSILQDLWMSTDHRRTNPMKYPEDMEIHDNWIQEQRLYTFLTAIDGKYESTKREIVKMEPLLSVDLAYNLIKQEETRSQVLQSGATITADGIGAGLIVWGGRISPAAARGAETIKVEATGTGEAMTRAYQSLCVPIARRKSTQMNHALS